MTEFEEDAATLAARCVLDDLLADQMDANRHIARRADGIRTALDHARLHPEVYTHLDGQLGVRAAESAVLLEISLRLQLAEPQVRGLAVTAESAALHVPRLWQRAHEGFAPFALVEATCGAILRLMPAADATPDERCTALAAIDLVDEQAAEWVLHLTAGAYRRRLAALVGRLDPRDAARRHAAAFAERRVVVEDAEDGMAWLSVLTSRVDAIAVKQRLTAAARHLQKTQRAGRDRDQLRADLAVAWLRGEGTQAAVKTKVFVTIPVGVLTGAAAGPDGRCAICGGSGIAERARVAGDGDLDPVTAKQLFLDAKSYRRVIIDPIRSIVVDMERHSRRATRAQRDWLILQHGTCSRDGCTRLAVDADFDHIVAWARGGRTNLAELRPLCPADHRRRHDTRIRYRTREDGTTEVRTPTGLVSDEPPPF